MSDLLDAVQRVHVARPVRVIQQRQFLGYDVVLGAEREDTPSVSFEIRQSRADQSWAEESWRELHHCKLLEKRLGMLQG